LPDKSTNNVHVVSRRAPNHLATAYNTYCYEMCF
jgi:hypothetical protein